MTVDQLEDKLIDLSFAEDIGDGDHTTLCCIPEDAMGKSQLLIKEEGILAGVEVAKRVFARFDPTMRVEVLMEDGTHVKKGDVAMIVTGKVRSLLQTERLMLNIMQRMSGIATMTQRYVKRLEGTGTHVLDTRKTTPGMRMLEKQAVKIGGGMNHRIGLFDMILLKDNHIDWRKGEYKNVFNRPQETPKATNFVCYTGTCDYTLKNTVLMDMLGQILDIVYTATVREDEGGALDRDAGRPAAAGVRPVW